MTKKIAAILAALALSLGFGLGPADAQSSARNAGQQFYHDNVGNIQAIGVVCADNSGPYWVQIAQWSNDKCGPLTNGSSRIYMPYNYRAVCISWNDGSQLIAPGGGMTWLPSGKVYRCYSQHTG